MGEGGGDRADDKRDLCCSMCACGLSYVLPTPDSSFLLHRHIPGEPLRKKRAFDYQHMQMGGKKESCTFSYIQILCTIEKEWECASEQNRGWVRFLHSPPTRTKVLKPPLSRLPSTHCAVHTSLTPSF